MLLQEETYIKLTSLYWVALLVVLPRGFHYPASFINGTRNPPKQQSTWTPVLYFLPSWNNKAFLNLQLPKTMFPRFRAMENITLMEKRCFKGFNGLDCFKNHRTLAISSIGSIMPWGNDGHEPTSYEIMKDILISAYTGIFNKLSVSRITCYIALLT